MEALVFAANISYVCACFTSDMLRLRILSLLGASCLAFYFFWRPEPMLTVVGWNLFFIVLNLFQLCRLIAVKVWSSQA